MDGAPIFLSRVEVDELHAESLRLYDALIAIAERRMTKPELAALFRELFAAQ